MRQWFLAVVLFAAMAAAGFAQTNVTFAWDASASGPGPADNPIKYRLYQCADQAYTQCAFTDAGTALQLTVPMQTGFTYVLARAYQYSLVVDGKPAGSIIESGNSNVLKIQVIVPPGNPANVKIKVSE